MAGKPRARMPISQRAKQFSPFEAVGGLDEALRRAEEEHRRELETSNLVHAALEEGENPEPPED